MKKQPALIIALAMALVAPLGAVAAETAPAEPAAKEAREAKDARSKKAEPCIDTSSRIRRQKAGECTPSAAPTRSWSREEIEQTGETDVGQALRKLDPRFQ